MNDDDVMICEFGDWLSKEMKKMWLLGFEEIVCQKRNRPLSTFLYLTGGYGRIDMHMLAHS